MNSHANHESHSSTALPSGGLLAICRMIALWRERARQRRALGQLDDYMLRDLGLTRLDVNREAARPFWQ